MKPADPTQTTSASRPQVASIGSLAVEELSSGPPASLMRAKYEKLVRRYYYQLTVGCSDRLCNVKLCASCPSGPQLTPQAAAIMAVQLASRPKNSLCPRIPLEPPEISAKDDPTRLPVNSSELSRSPMGIISPLTSPKMLRKSLNSTSSATNNTSATQTGPSSNRASNDQLNTSSSMPSKPFLFSLLSSSPFSNLFRSSSVDSARDQLARSKSSISVFSSTADTNSVYPQNKRAESEVTQNDILGLKSLGRLGNDGTDGIKVKARSLFDLTMVTSPVNEPPDLEGRCDSVTEISKIADDEASRVSFSSSFYDSQPILAPLSLIKLEAAINAFNSCPENNSATLASTIRYAFSNSDSLNKSFMVDGNDSKLDFDGIRKSYDLILNLEPKEKWERILVNALELLLATIQLNTKRYQTGIASNLRQFLILLENPLLRDKRYQGSLLKKLCLIIGNLRSKSKIVISKWISQYNHNELLALTDMIHGYISDNYSPGLKVDESIISAIRILSVVYHANESKPPTRIIPITSFYNEAINKKLNFKDEYRQWKKTLDSTKITEFSFFNYPFLFDPVSKTRILHIDAMVQMSQEFEDAVVHQAVVMHAQRFLQDSQSVTTLEQGLKGATNPFLVLEIRRQHMVKDVLDQISKKEKDLKKPLKVKFVGGGEEGMDQGGVQKEFFQVLVNMLLDPAYGMFVYEEETRFCWINGASLDSEKKFELVGVVLGLALYNGIILGVNFPPLLYKKLLDEEPDLEDLKISFPTLGRGLQQLLDWEDGDVSDIFMRSFEISYEVYGQVKNFPLIPDGENIPVTNANRKEFVDLYLKHYIGYSVQVQFDAFRRGFHRVCGGRALKMCRPDELELLICGTTDLDFKDLERGAEYDDGYNPDHQVIIWFWEIVHAMSVDLKKQLLLFVTASDRVPLKGLGNLKFVIQRNGPDTDRLPTALTCFGRLLLPEFSSKEKLENRLLTAIQNAKGFGLV